MTMNCPTPNHLIRTHDGVTSFSFGALHSVVAHPLCSGSPHVDVRFRGGLKMELSPQTVQELLVLLPTALEALPFIPDIHDAVGGDDE